MSPQQQEAKDHRGQSERIHESENIFARPSQYLKVTNIVNVARL
jgi:hypothetical protein